MSRAKVYILQEPFKRDKATGQMVPVMNFARAAEYGEPVVCLPPGPVALSPYPTKEALKECLKDITDEDYIICVGDPSLIFIAGMLVCDMLRGKGKFLKYDRDSQAYIKVEIDIFKKLGQNLS